MRDYTTLTLISVFAFIQTVFSQENQKKAGVITGKIYDAALQKPIEFANIILFGGKDSTMVTGATSGEGGGFQIDKIPPGTYDAEIHFIGYKKKRLDNLDIGPAKFEIDVGKVLLEQTTVSLEGVEVQGEAMGMTYQIDRKVINVAQQQTAISGTAVDVLENVPSVTVDIEGNVSLRGSSNFTVLIDGRPAVMEPSEALQQIPAGTIENIEIITNPSAKYDPEGAAGMINIILKKDQRSGRSGMVNLNAGFGNKYGGDVLYDYKEGNYHGTLGVDYNNRSFTGNDREENQTMQEAVSSFIHSNGGSRRRDIALGLRGELELDLGRKDALSLGGRYGHRQSQRGSDLNYVEWAEPVAEKLFYASTTERDRKRDFYALILSYQHRFAPKGHELYAEMFFSRRHGDEATTHGLRASDGAISSGHRATEAGPSRDLRAKLDYTLALGKDAKFEAGYQSELDRSDDLTGSYEYDPIPGEYMLQPQFSNRTRYDENIHALYAMVAGEWKRLGYQAGLRGEYMDRAIASQGSAQRFSINRWDYFPTIHFSREFAAGQQAMASYTRRVDRPNGGDLEPFLTWTDAYNVRTGNAALQPEFIDSYEIGYQTHFGPSLISAEAYYRETHNKIEDVRSVYDDNITLHSVENIGKDYAFGSELSLNFDLSKKWNVHAMGNLYNYRIQGALFGESLARESFTWNSRLSNTVKIGASAQIQLDGMYNSPSVSTQGRREGFFIANASVKYEFLDKLLSATLQVRDVFGSAKNERISQGADFYTYSYSTREAPVVMLNLKYNFNDYKPERQPNREAADNEEDN